MKTVGVLIFSLGLGLLYTEDGMSQTLSPHPAVQGKAIHPSEVHKPSFHARHPQAQAITKGKIGGAKGAETKQCYKVVGIDHIHEGPIISSQSDLNHQCNITYTGCQGSCFAF